VPAALLEEVFALNEELDEIRSLRESGGPEAGWKAQLQRARQPIDAKRARHEEDLRDLSAQWDAIVERGGNESDRRAVLTALHQRMLERNYINNLLATIDREAGAIGNS
jgi:hypothetical protein